MEVVVVVLVLSRVRWWKLVLRRWMRQGRKLELLGKTEGNNVTFSCDLICYKK
jgi:hypothetical protein